MKNREPKSGFIGRIFLLMVAFTSLSLAFGANADDCFTIHSKSGATPGTKSCKLDVTSNTPGGLGNYACISRPE